MVPLREFFIIVSVILTMSALADVKAQTQSVLGPAPAPVLPTTNPNVSDNPFLNSGKLDFQYRHTPLTDEYNFMFWSPVFKGGFGVIDSDLTGVTTFAGGFCVHW